MFCSSDPWITSLLLVALFPLTRGFIMCKCDTPGCRAANVTECKAEFYCYVSFRPAKPSEEKPPNSKSMHGAGSKLFIAEQRGCASHDQLDLCTNPRSNFNGVGSFGNLNFDEDGRSRSTIVRCCSDNYCEISQKLEFTQAELDGRQFFLNAEISDLEPGLDFPMLPPTSAENDFPFRESPKKHTDTAMGPVQQKQQRKRPSYANGAPFTHQWFPGLPQPPNPSHDPPLPADFENPAKNRDVLVKREEAYAPAVQSKQIHKEIGREEDGKEEERPPILLQPLHIAIGVCLIILMLVAVLLHVVVVLHRRQRRLKREFLKQTQKANSNDVNHQQTQQWQIASSTQSNVQQINLQQLQYSSASSDQNRTAISRRSKKSCCISCAWKRPQTKTSSPNVYDEVLSHQTQAEAPVVATPKSEMQFRQCLPHEAIHSSQTPVTYHSSLQSSGATPPTLPSTPAMNPQPPPPPPNPIMQPVMYSPHSPEHNFQLNSVKNAFGTGSSVSGGSGNNPSTAESSLPTHSPAVAGWNNNNNNNSNSNPVFLLHNGFSSALQHATNLERPSLSGSSEAGGLITPDFETRRANVALPPALLGGDLSGPRTSSPQTNPTSLAIFRSAAPQSDACSLVTPYAQLQLSLSFDQYDTPEQIFGDGTTSAGGSASLDGFGDARNNNQASSNPTTNSSLLHSYCEHGGTGDFRA
ncbi:hypothetical protein Aperf_G00000066198 [Anoplocephala perfoliata]